MNKEDIRELAEENAIYEFNKLKKIYGEFTDEYVRHFYNKLAELRGGIDDVHTCNCQHIYNSRDNEPCCRCDSRNPNNPSDRTVGNQTEQRLEVNMQGTSNCLTSVQKDNLVIESQVLTPKRTEYGKQIRKAYESGQIQESRHNMTELEPRKDDISNTLTTVQKDNLLLENNIQKVGQISSNGSQCGTVISDNGISANLVAGTHGYANSHIATQYRIRKLTPRECGRLMGVSDEDIDKMAAVNSNTQLYKQFGNSIVVDVMCAMFKNLNINQGDSNEALQTD